MHQLRLLLSALMAFAPQVAQALAETACVDAALRAARDTGVPPDLLVAITLTETRYQGTSWPWTINLEGEGFWYPTAEEAIARTGEILETGGTPDVGCFQISTAWHPDAFASVKDMFDPDLNAAYAARLLRDLYDGTGSWADAVGDYHSRDPDLGGAYMMRVGATLAELQASNTAAAAPASADRPRRNGFPLLAGGMPTNGASLFPRLSGGTPLIGAP